MNLSSKTKQRRQAARGARLWLLGLTLGSSIVVTGCAPSQPAAPPRPATPSRTTDSRVDVSPEVRPGAAPQTAWKPEKLAVEHLPNAYRIHEKVISGGMPEGDAAFQELADLGVKTVISVDGAKPDVAAARRHGLRYVHLPHGYDGVPEERARQLAKAVRDLPGPVYLHCHHGKHRSPAAATVACVSVGFLAAADALTVLETAGTSENYRGLYQSARQARRLEDRLLDDLSAVFPETARLPPMAEAMVAVEHAHDHLKLVAQAAWRTPPEHPALVPAHEALLLREHFTELLRTDDAAARGDSFRASLTDSETAARELEAALRTTPWTEEAARAATAAHQRISQQCVACHREHRDVPLGEKKRR